MNNKILFIDHDRGISGSTISLKFIVDKFIIEGWKVSVLTRKDLFLAKKYYGQCIDVYNTKGRFLNYVLNTHICEDSIIFSKKWIINSIKNIFRFFIGIFISLFYLIKLSPNVLYINEHATFHFSMGAYLLRVKSIIHIRSLFIKGNFRISNFLIRKIIIFCNDWIIPITGIEAKQFFSQSKKIKIVHEFLSSSDYMKYEKDDVINVRKKLQLSSDKTIVLFLGGIDSIKGTFEFVSSIKGIISLITNVDFLLIGSQKNSTVDDKKYYDKVMNQIKLDKLEDILKIIDFTDKVRDYILASNIIVTYPTISHFSRPAIEAWALKKAIISSRVIHNNEYMYDGVNSLIVDNGDFSQLSDAIVKLVNDKKLYLKISNNGFKDAEDKFSASKNLDLIFNLCSKLYQKN